MKKEYEFGAPLTFWEALFLLFLGLKLANVITWSWIWVFAPVWVYILIVFIALCVIIKRDKK